MAKRPTKAPPAPLPAAAAPRKSGRPTSAKPRAKKAAPPPEAAPESPAASAPPQPEAADPFAYGADQRQLLETLSLNLAKAAMTAQSAIAEAALSQADRPAALSPDPFNVAPAMTSVMTSLAARPEKLFQAQADLFGRYMDLWSTTARRAMGEEVAPAPSTDKRFRDPAWSENPVFDVMRQSYLVTSDWMNGLVSSVEDVDPRVKRRAEFFTKLLTDAFSPANFLASNPAALKALAETGGESLVKGMQNFAADLERGNGKLKISQADYGQFKVGENVATAPGQVVWRDELFELIQFDAATETQHAIPLLIFPPWINKFYIMDLQPANSLIRWLSAQGFTVFICSWVNPDIDKAEFGFDDYLNKGIYRAIAKVLEQTDQKQLNAVGYCIGGTLLGSALAHMTANKDTRVASATFFAAQHDFAEAGDLLLFTDEHWLAEIEQQMDAAGGVLPGAAMAETFNALRANDLIWSFFVSNYLMGKAPPAFDLLFWNADQTRMPKRLHLDYLRRMYGQNALAKGEFEIDGQRIDLSTVKTPLYFLSSREDHIAPMNSVYRSARLFGGPVTYTLAGSGHIAGVINPPAANKYQHWINPALPETLEEWQAGAQQHPGSWWTHWAAWLREKSGKTIPARDPKTGPLKPIEPAPGAYVKVKS
ncbi:MULTISPECIES: class I poly(R)-hydroxyalkanoic acid synthase [unclassified Brevundimonas]|uniref:class I poly(R)-hydroxyalkanoic acid synthase n=1 Tax=unclassified Brevundimonas TaxID=2622653 RepID=UPI000CFDBC20|nr:MULTISPECIES: class I poly(R)-hydroxyalkanoic acid synthase [unclassified Brevundimonas]PRA34444.1 class I poly(R)-hydroxyalkanoic acid synthase [Brevundimonas sp. MYb27]PQZ84144.1 class I poly(R)-hydroxyalkanoic acid synthase [Brevundimonas sp. MYb31]PRB17883.1 class I poly(R)-hydroxyalkanoic acid synthase [Brevundimonas sp. MYb52]PRB38254.1 class I poly(R)-hydroxyalkanoic acid synthase [Brevundimonas sp. MYb46]PRB55965.1 class I poly(R)-hydroxyalkanoic acid synthase [Brevundimonas sp. MYb